MTQDRSARPTIVVITTSYPTIGDGSESAGSFVKDLVEEIAALVHVKVVAPGGANAIEDTATGVQVFRYKAPSLALSTLKPWKLGDFINICKVLHRGDRALRRAASTGDVRVLACWALPSGWWARRLAKRDGTDYFVWTLGSDIWSLGRVPIARWLLRKVLADAKQCYSDGLKLARDTKHIGRLQDVGFLPSTRRIECAREHPVRHASPYRLLFIGRWHANKGIDILLEALMRLDDLHWARIESVEIHGGGPLEKDVHTGVARLIGCGRPVQLHGYADKATAQRAFLSSDFVLIPSRIESVPVVFSDAMKLGCPVVVTPVGDLPDLVRNGSCGICAASADPGAFCDAISEALSRPADSFSRGVAKTAAQFDLGAVSRRLVAEFFDGRHK